MSASARLTLIFFIVAGSFLLMPLIGLPYGDLDWVVHSQPYQPPQVPPAPDVCVYTVQYGDTLFSIARRFGTSVENILYANSIRNIHYIRAGQTLVIPHCRQPAECVVYTVQRGDTLFSIARRHSTSPRAIALQNRIVYPWRIFAGQQILICPGGGLPLPEARTYVVRPGDTIWSIAFRFGTSPYAVIAANNLQYPGLIFPGQELRIP